MLELIGHPETLNRLLADLPKADPVFPHTPAALSPFRFISSPGLVEYPSVRRNQDRRKNKRIRARRRLRSYRSVSLPSPIVHTIDFSKLDQLLGKSF